MAQQLEYRRRAIIDGVLRISAITIVSFACFVPAFAQKRVIQKWVARVEAPAGGQGPTAPVIATDAQGNVFVAGNPHFAPSPAVDPSTEFLTVVKYNAAGQQLWSTSFHTPDNAPIATAATVDASGNFFVAGMGFQDGPGAEYFTAKFSPSGSLDWSAAYSFNDFNCCGDITSSSVVGIAVDSQGNSYMTGFVKEDTAGPITTIKYSPTGTRLWLVQFDDGNVDIASGMTLDAQNNVLVAGHILPCENACVPGNDFGVTIKYNSSGAQLWAVYTGKPTSAPAGTSHYANGAITVDSTGNSYVAGWFNTDGSVCHPNTNTSVPCQTGSVTKYSPTGSMLWTEQNPLWGSTAIKLDREGHIFTAGSHFNSNSSRFSVTRLDPSGNLLWNRLYNHTETGDDEAFALAVNADSDSYITGQSTSTNNATGLDCVTLKLDYQGNLDWIAVYNGPGSGNDRPYGITFSGSYLYVAAASVGANKAPGWATIAYLQDAAVVTPSTLTFPAQKIGTVSAAQSVTLTNTYWGDDLKLGTIAVNGPFQVTDNCPASIVPFASCTLKITYRPTAAGAQTGTVEVFDQWAGSPAIIHLTGTGTH